MQSREMKEKSSAKKVSAATHPGRKGNAISLAPLTPAQALAAALRVNPEDVKKLEQQEAVAKKKKAKPKK